MQNEIPTHVLSHLLNNEEYCRRVIPYIQKEYFDGCYKVVFDLIVGFVAVHNKLPTGRVLDIELQKVSAPEDILNQSSILIKEISVKTDLDTEYLIVETEKWCKDRAVYLAIMDSIQIIDGKDENRSEGAIPDILSTALGVSFDQQIGHDYIDDADGRFEFYNNVEEKIPFDLDYFNKITKGGIPNKTLNVCLAGTGVGKSLFMCHCAAANLTDNKNVLYITMEMAEERIAERIDANLLNIPIDQIENLSKNMFAEKVNEIKTKTNGQLIIKEYPTGAANANHFRALLNELKLKKSFVPDVIYIDYLNICSSARMKAMGGSINSYTYIKAIAEEMRGLAVEFDLPIFSATQTTRSGFSSSDPGLEDTSESFGLPATADFMFALVSSEELDQLGQIMVKQLKNRYNDLNAYKRFVVGVDRSKMRLVDADETQQNLVEDKPAFDKSDFGQGQEAEDDKFRDFKL